MMGPPEDPRIYHIVHVDRLSSIVADGCMWCDSEVQRNGKAGTSIGMSGIKSRRLHTGLSSHPNLHVGDCVPFYFSPRSVMLYVIHRANSQDLGYRGGQEPIIHLEASLHKVVEWAIRNGQRWAFTLTNAGSFFFEDRCDLTQLHEIDWEAVQARDWQQCKDGKQAEFLLERNFPWDLIECIGVCSPGVYRRVVNALPSTGHRPLVKIRKDWYY